MKAGRDRKYTTEFRDAAVKQVVDGGRGISAVARSLEISSSLATLTKAFMLTSSRCWKPHVALPRRFEEGGYGLSARRLWERTERAQINVFSQAISARRELIDAAAFIDLIWFDADTFSPAGVTLVTLKIGRLTDHRLQPA